MSRYLASVWLMLTLDLRQRVRSTAWYVILGVYAAVLLVFSVGAAATVANWAGGGVLYSVVVYFVLLLATLVSPALSGTAINGEREAGTLATIQVTSITTGQIVLGKFLAAWATSLVFLAVSVPFLALGLAFGEISALTVLSSTLILAAELGVLSAIGVGLSGLIRKPLFSVVVSYLVIAGLSIGTLLVFGIAGTLTQTPVKVTTIQSQWTTDPESGESTALCDAPEVRYETTPRYDLYWGFLAANPYVVVADASARDFDQYGTPRDVFGFIASGVRLAQQTPEAEKTYDYCRSDSDGTPGITAEESLRTGAPSWFLGLAIQAALGAGALLGAWRATRAPSGRLGRESRIA
ncbi:ABC transporter permease [Cnuibacter physcomitrellae]|uniref:Uncharacterized protein n=1 Tax=Cnuibacter physcomitrellae TaxID=1619308 RepID=A0A1X9LKR4_9MICO|nr:ABC transporter permease [Cnuibacter physcomitrellae]ARJ05796.1 hypothetical protein B5808_11600 [Cnuibacter physcomitrellae]GGI36508.1 ABC transporter permease [Cnuibacter physcomitrellae]